MDVRERAGTAVEHRPRLLAGGRSSPRRGPGAGLRGRAPGPRRRAAGRGCVPHRASRAGTSRLTARATSGRSCTTSPTGGGPQAPRTATGWTSPRTAASGCPQRTGSSPGRCPPRTPSRKERSRDPIRTRCPCGAGSVVLDRCRALRPAPARPSGRPLRGVSGRVRQASDRHRGGPPRHRRSAGCRERDRLRRRPRRPRAGRTRPHGPWPGCTASAVRPSPTGDAT